MQQDSKAVERWMNSKITVIPYPHMQYRHKAISSIKQFSVKLWQKTPKLLQILLQKDGWLINFVALLLGRVSILGEISPFGLAFFAAVVSVNRERAVGVAFWTLIGLFSTKPGLGGLAAVGAITLFFRLMRGERVRPEKKLIAYPVLIFVCVLLARLITATVFNQTLYGYLLALFDATITLVLTLVFLYGVPMVTRREMGRTLSSEEMISIVVMLASVVAGIPHVVIQGVAVDHVCGRLVIMLLAFIGGGNMGAAVGVAVGVVSSLSEVSVFAGIGFYAFAGLLAGLFRNFGKWGVGIGFLAGNLILTLYLGQSAEIFFSLIETVMAMFIIFIIPKKRIHAIRQMIPATGMDLENTDIKLREMSLQKLLSYAKVFSEMVAAFEQCGTYAQQKNQEDSVAQLLGDLGERVCKGCSQRYYCWERDFYRTYRSLTDALILAEAAGGITTETLPENMKSFCPKPQELLNNINLLLERQQAYNYWQRKVQETRGMVTEQMRALAVILENFAREMDKNQFIDEEIAQIVREKAEELGYNIDEIQVLGDNNRTLQVEIYKQTCRGNQECVNNIIPLLNNLLQERFRLRTECAREGRRGRCYLKLTIQEQFYLLSGVAREAKDPSGISGDTYAILPLRRGKIAVLLSDGMGIGSKAAHQSATTIHLLQQLMAVGFDLDVTVKTVNSLLLLHTPEETFATVDLVVIDLYNGEAEFLKIGSAPSFIKRVREVSTVRSTSLPLGILSHIEIESAKRQLVAGDLIIMVTDGILDAEKKNVEKEEWVAKLLRRIACENPREVADIILRQAKKATNGEVIDDMTVLVLRLEEKLPFH
jgi:stage II sporulation protein E